MNARFALVFGLILLLGSAARGQAPPAASAPAANLRRDSMEAALRRQPRPDTLRLHLLNEVIWENRDSNPARALALAQEALALGQRLHSARGLAKTHVLRGIIYATSGRLAEAIDDFEACRRLRAALGDWQGVAGAINNVAEVQAQQGRYALAVRTYVRALRLEERYGTPSRVAEDLANLGLVYYQMGRYREALAYQLRYLRLPGRRFDANIDAAARNAAGQSFARLGQTDSARAFFRHALALSRSNDDRRHEAQALAHLGGLEAGQRRFGPAAAAYRQALALQTQLNDRAEQANSLLALAALEAGQQRAAPARGLYRQALAVGLRIRSREVQRAARAGLATAHARRGSYAEAYAESQLAAALRDSLLDASSIRQIVEMQTRYETERKESQNRLLLQRQQLQAAQLREQHLVIRRRTTLLGAGALVAALLAGLAYLLHNRRRLRREVEFAQERQQLERGRATAVLNAEEAERRRIGADLHDGVGQLLSVVKLNVNALCEELRPRLTDAECHRFGDALDLVDESVGEVRSISHNLLPNALIKRGLARAVREFLDKVRQAGRLRIQLETLGLDEPRLDPAVESALYRVIQEVVQNIVKHAQASEITLQLIRHEGELTLLVEDNGVGFDPAALGPDAGIGLRNIESRVAYLGGVLELDSRPGHGTTVTATVPLGAMSNER